VGWGFGRFVGGFGCVRRVMGVVEGLMDWGMWLGAELVRGLEMGC